MSLRVGNGWGGGGGKGGRGLLLFDHGQQVDAAGRCAVPWASSWKDQLLAPRCRPCPLETTNHGLNMTLGAGTIGQSDEACSCTWQAGPGLLMP